MNGVPSTTYSYNCHHLLKQINSPGGKWEKFYYDGLGRRIKTEYYDGYTTTTRKYVYLGGSVIRELDDSEPTPQVVREYIRGGGLGGGIGSIIYCKEGSDYYYFHYNPWPGRHKGDVISITDADKEEVAYYEYDACLPACASRCSECGRVGPARMADGEAQRPGGQHRDGGGKLEQPLPLLDEGMGRRFRPLLLRRQILLPRNRKMDPERPRRQRRWIESLYLRGQQACRNPGRVGRTRILDAV